MAIIFAPKGGWTVFLVFVLGCVLVTIFGKLIQSKFWNRSIENLEKIAPALDVDALLAPAAPFAP
jgi:predicted benzoate:H+ symporter BenE